MGTHTIEEVVAVSDAEDQLAWHVRVATDFVGTVQARAFFLHWEGVAAFYREPVKNGHKLSANVQRLTLPAIWINRNQASRVLIPRETTFEFQNQLSARALDRIEHFRNGGRLYGRIEGQLTWIYNPGPDNQAGSLEAVARLVGDPSMMQSVDVFTEAKELTRDYWQQSVLGSLRPADRHVLEITLPQGSPEGEVARKALAHLSEARRAFDDGRYEETARVVYRALDEMNSMADLLAQRYGNFARDRFRDQLKAIRALCNPARHGDDETRDAVRTDCMLARHILIAGQNAISLLTS